MAYATSKLTHVMDLGGPVGMALWKYDTADTAATVDTDAYISDASNRRMKKGDLVIVRVWSAVPSAAADLATAGGTAPTLTGVYLHAVKGINTTGTADLTDGVAIATNTD